MAAGSPKQRILLVTNWLGWAGAETQLEHLAIGLSRSGHEVTLLSIGGIFVDLEPLRSGGVHVLTLNISHRWQKLFAPFRIARYARKADVVHCTGWDATLWGRLGALIARRPMLITEHTPGREYQLSQKGASRERIIALHNRLLSRFTYATIAVGSWQRELLEDEGVAGSSIVHVPNAVPIDELREQAEAGPTRDFLGIPQDSAVVIEVARFAPQKGQALLLRVVAELRNRLGDVRVLFVGSGDTEEEVKREAARLGADWATFLGLRSDVPGLLELSDVSVLPSTGEGLPMSLIESIAMGTPVIATDVGDIRWLIEKTGGGICVKPEDEEAFMDALEQVLADPELRGRLGKAALAGVADLDAPVMVERYERIFADAAASRSASAGSGT